MAPKEETSGKFQALLKTTGSTLGAWRNHGGKQSQQQQRQPKGNFSYCHDANVNIGKQYLTIFLRIYNFKCKKKLFQGSNK